MKARLYDIRWDTDGEPHELPTEMTVDVDCTTEDDYEAAAVDAASDVTGFCIENAMVEVVA